MMGMEWTKHDGNGREWTWEVKIIEMGGSGHGKWT